MEETRDIEEFEMILEGSDNEVKTLQEGIYDYNEFTNKPSINGNTLKGNKSSTELGLVGKTEFDNEVSKLRQEYENKTNSVKKELTEQTNNLEQNLRNEIAVIKRENQDLKQENQKIKDQLPSGTASGNAIYLDDSSDMELELRKIKGGHRQETRSGKNLLNFNVTQNSKVTVNKDGTITINGQGGFNLRVQEFTAKANTEYYQKWELISGAIDTTNSNGKVFMTIDNLKYTNEGNFASVLFSEDTTKKGIWIHESAVFTNAKIKMWMNTDKSDFEPYGVSPSPEFPSEIETVNGSVEIDVGNKNRLRITSPLKQVTLGGIDITINGNIITLNGTCIGAVWPDFTYGIASNTVTHNKCKYYLQKEKEDYIASIKVLNGTASGGSMVIVCNDVDSSVNFSLNLKTLVQPSSKKINGVNRIYLSGLTSGIKFDNFTFELQLEKGTTATDFVEHQSQTAIMPIQQEMLEGDYIADIEHHEWGKILLTGYETGTIYFTMQNNYVLFQIKGNEDMLRGSKLICNFLKNEPNWGIDNESIYVGGIDNNYIQVKILSSRLTETTEQGIIAWLKSKYEVGNPITIYYKLATPIDLELTESQKAIAKQIKQTAHTYKNITNISAESAEVNPIVNVKYLKDTETEHKKLQSQIDEIKQLLSTTQTSSLLLDNMQKDLESEVE